MLSVNNKIISSLLSTIATNCIPIIGVIFLHWNPFSILFIYTIEMTVLLIFTIIKILIVFKKAVGPILTLLFTGPIFIGTYLFMTIAAFWPGGLKAITSLQTIILEQVQEHKIAIINLVAIYLIVFILKFIKAKEYLSITKLGQLTLPYGVYIFTLQIIVFFLGKNDTLLTRLSSIPWLIIAIIFSARTIAEIYFNYKSPISSRPTQSEIDILRFHKSSANVLY